MKKRTKYEDLYDAGVEKMKDLNKSSLHEYRITIKNWLNDIDKKIKDERLSDSKRSYYVGLRKFVILPLLKYSKDRIKMINRVIYNGTGISHAQKFVEVASSVLPMKVFQQIYALSVSEEEIEKQTIEDVKKFLDECESRTNGNIK